MLIGRSLLKTNSVQQLLDSRNGQDLGEGGVRAAEPAEPQLRRLIEHVGHNFTEEAQLRAEQAHPQAHTRSVCGAFVLATEGRVRSCDTSVRTHHCLPRSSCLVARLQRSSQCLQRLGAHAHFVRAPTRPSVFSRACWLHPAARLYLVADCLALRGYTVYIDVAGKCPALSRVYLPRAGGRARARPPLLVRTRS